MALPTRPTLRVERALHRETGARIAGVDEAGRGAWAGPVSAGAVILPLGPVTTRHLRGVTDSKQLTAAARAHYAGVIRAEAVAWAVGFAEADEIDALGILPATRLAMRRAIAALHPAAGALVIDAVHLTELDLPQRVFNFADAISLSVAAASILAKTARDARLTALDADFPGFGFAAHKGYGVAAHAAALARHGPCPEHRRSFKPVAATLR